MRPGISFVPYFYCSGFKEILGHGKGRDSERGTGRKAQCALRLHLHLSLRHPCTVPVYVGRQVRKPTGYVGRLFARTMYNSHGRLQLGAVSSRDKQRRRVLDLGCGGGRTKKLPARAASVYAIDYVGSGDATVRFAAA